MKIRNWKITVQGFPHSPWRMEETNGLGRRVENMRYRTVVHSGYFSRKSQTRKKKLVAKDAKKRGALDARFAIILKERRDQFDKTTGFDQHASFSQTKRADSRS